MSINERLTAVAETIQGARAELRRIAVDLPDGATLEVLDSAEARAGYIIALLNDEARVLRRWNE
jgi:hypothetical protein